LLVRALFRAEDSNLLRKVQTLGAKWAGKARYGCPQNLWIRWLVVILKNYTFVRSSWSRITKCDVWRGVLACYISSYPCSIEQ